MGGFLEKGKGSKYYDDNAISVRYDNNSIHTMLTGKVANDGIKNILH